MISHRDLTMVLSIVVALLVCVVILLGVPAPPQARLAATVFSCSSGLAFFFWWLVSLVRADIRRNGERVERLEAQIYVPGDRSLKRVK